MQISIAAKQISIGVGFRERIESEIENAARKYAGRPTEATITLLRDGRQVACEISIHLSTGLHAQARSGAEDVEVAFESCLDRMEKQLRRYKRRLKDHHHHRPMPIETEAVAAYVIAPDDAEEKKDSSPVIIAELEARVPTLDVGEAVMQMEIGGDSLLVFRNAAHGGINVVHKREDGNVGWVDPGSGKG